jgi:hypothetical protein
MPAEPRERDHGGGGDEGAAPPFLSWPAIYLVVLGALAVEIVLGVLLSMRFQ